MIYDDWHGQTGHLNMAVLDQDSVVTGYGQHARVVAFLPDSDGLYCRHDRKWGLPDPSPDQVLTVARKDQGVRGRWKLRETVEHDNGISVDWFFDRV